MRCRILILLLSMVAGGFAAVLSDGRALFAECEFRQAARMFEKAVAAEPGRADLHFWLGRSYARLAEVSGPLTAPAHARRARRELEQALRLEPRNQLYLGELFEFYLASPEWFSGGLERAEALLERLDPDPFGDSTARMGQLAAARREYRGAGWRMRQAALLTSGGVGRLTPQW